jgi:hypothetical protein
MGRQNICVNYSKQDGYSRSTLGCNGGGGWDSVVLIRSVCLQMEVEFQLYSFQWVKLTVFEVSWFSVNILWRCWRALTHLFFSVSLSVKTNCVSVVPGGEVWQHVNYKEKFNTGKHLKFPLMVFECFFIDLPCILSMQICKNWIIPSLV